MVNDEDVSSSEESLRNDDGAKGFFTRQIIRYSFNRNRQKHDFDDVRKTSSIANNVRFSKVQAKEFLWPGYLIVIYKQDFLTGES